MGIDLVEYAKQKAQEIANKARPLAQEAVMKAEMKVLPEWEECVRMLLETAIIGFYEEYAPKEYDRMWALFDVLPWVGGDSNSFSFNDINNLYVELDKSKALGWRSFSPGETVNVYDNTFRYGAHGNVYQGAPILETMIASVNLKKNEYREKILQTAIDIFTNEMKGAW